MNFLKKLYQIAVVFGIYLTYIGRKENMATSHELSRHAQWIEMKKEVWIEEVHTFLLNVLAVDNPVKNE